MTKSGRADCRFLRFMNTKCVICPLLRMNFNKIIFCKCQVLYNKIKMNLLIFESTFQPNKSCKKRKKPPLIFQF